MRLLLVPVLVVMSITSHFGSADEAGVRYTGRKTLKLSQKRIAEIKKCVEDPVCGEGSYRGSEVEAAEATSNAMLILTPELRAQVFAGCPRSAVDFSAWADCGARRARVLIASQPQARQEKMRIAANSLASASKAVTEMGTIYNQCPILKQAYCNRLKPTSALSDALKTQAQPDLEISDSDEAAANPADQPPVQKKATSDRATTVDETQAHAKSGGIFDIGIGSLFDTGIGVETPEANVGNECGGFRSSHCETPSGGVLSDTQRAEADWSADPRSQTYFTRLRAFAVRDYLCAMQKQSGVLLKETDLPSSCHQSWIEPLIKNQLAAPCAFLAESLTPEAFTSKPLLQDDNYLRGALHAAVLIKKIQSEMRQIRTHVASFRATSARSREVLAASDAKEKELEIAKNRLQQLEEQGADILSRFPHLAATEQGLTPDIRKDLPTVDHLARLAQNSEGGNLNPVREELRKSADPRLRQSKLGSISRLCDAKNGLPWQALIGMESLNERFLRANPDIDRRYFECTLHLSEVQHQRKEGVSTALETGCYATVTATGQLYALPVCSAVTAGKAVSEFMEAEEKLYNTGHCVVDTQGLHCTLKDYEKAEQTLNSAMAHLALAAATLPFDLAALKGPFKKLITSLHGKKPPPEMLARLDGLALKLRNPRLTDSEAEAILKEMGELEKDLASAPVKKPTAVDRLETEADLRVAEEHPGDAEKIKKLSQEGFSSESKAPKNPDLDRALDATIRKYGSEGKALPKAGKLGVLSPAEDAELKRFSELWSKDSPAVRNATEVKLAPGEVIQKAGGGERVAAGTGLKGHGAGGQSDVFKVKYADGKYRIIRPFVVNGKNRSLAARRALAASELNEAMKMHTVARSRVVKFFDPASGKWVVGTESEVVDGMIIHELHLSQLDARNLSETEAFEFFIGNSDGHGANFFVDHNKKIWSFDAGAAFESSIQPQIFRTYQWLHGATMPKQYTREFVENLEKLTATEIRNGAGKNLTEKEIQGLLFRRQIILEDVRIKGAGAYLD